MTKKAFAQLIEEAEARGYQKAQEEMREARQQDAIYDLQDKVRKLEADVENIFTEIRKEK